MSTVFISYSSKNRSFAEMTRKYLCSIGVTCWMAPESICPGEEWADSIARIIPECKIMVLLWTSHSMQSRQVINELTLADRSGVMIIPVRLEEIEPEGAFKYYLYKTHWLDALDNTLRGKLELLGQRVLHNLPSNNEESGLVIEDIYKPPEPKTFSKSKLYALIFTLLFIVGVLIITRGVQVPNLSRVTSFSAGLKDDNSQKESVDKAVSSVQALYEFITEKQYKKASELMKAGIEWQIDEKFLSQFDRVSIEDLRVASSVGSTINLVGVVTFVWPDGSMQRESRSFAVNTSMEPPIITSTEFLRVIQSR